MQKTKTTEISDHSKILQGQPLAQHSGLTVSKKEAENVK